MRLDFIVKRRKVDAAILTWAAGASTTAHGRSTEIFTRWFDLKPAGRPEDRITIVDDRSDVYQAADFRRLEVVSTIVGRSDRGAIADLLAA